MYLSQSIITLKAQSAHQKLSWIAVTCIVHGGTPPEPSTVAARAWRWQYEPERHGLARPAGRSQAAHVSSTAVFSTVPSFT